MQNVSVVSGLSLYMGSACSQMTVSGKTRSILLNSPGNPAGGFISESAMRGIAELAIKHDLLVMTDEIYEHMAYDDHRHISIASLPGMDERTLTFNGLSKTYCMTGWRVGYVAGPQEIIRDMQKIHSHSVTCACGFSQKAAAVALNGPKDDLHTYIRTLRDRRKQLVALPVDLAERDGYIHAW